MLFCGLLIQMVIKQSDCLACLPALAEDGQKVPKNIYLLSSDSSVTILRSPAKYWMSWKSRLNWKSRRSAYCLGSVESQTADFTLVPLMSTFCSSLM